MRDYRAGKLPSTFYYEQQALRKIQALFYFENKDLVTEAKEC